MKRATLDLPLAGLEFKAKRVLTDIPTSSALPANAHTRCFVANQSESPRSGKPLICRWQALEFKVKRTLTNIPSASAAVPANRTSGEYHSKSHLKLL